MSQTSASYVRSFQQSINASPTALAIPSDISAIEIIMTSTADIKVRGLAADADVTLPTGTVHRLPVNAAGIGGLLVTNTAAVDVLVLGNRK